MEPADRSLAYHALRLRIVQLRYELGCLGGVTGLGKPLVAAAAALLCGMIAVIALLVGGCGAPAGLLSGGLLGTFLGGAAACGLMPIFDTITPAALAAARDTVDGIRKARAAEQEKIREFQAAQERREAYDRRVALAATAQSTTAKAATTQSRGWGEGSVCWYCSQRLPEGHCQCVYCRMLNHARVA